METERLWNATRASRSTQSAGSLPLPLNLAGVSATVNGLTAPLYYLSPGQLNIQVPYETSAGTAILGVNKTAKWHRSRSRWPPPLPDFHRPDSRWYRNGSGKAGAILLIYITGAGDLTPSIPTGYTPDPSNAAGRFASNAFAGGGHRRRSAGHCEFSGVTFGLVGVAQINFVVPQWPACRTAKAWL